MIAYSLKRKPLSDCTNIENGNNTHSKKHRLFAVEDMMPHTSPVKTNHDVEEVKTIYLQNVHPMLAMYKNDLVTDHMSFNTFSDLLAMDNETKLLDFLTELGVIAKHYQCEFCGYQMRKVKQRGVWYWLCTRRVAGLKCNRGKFGVRKGTFFDHSHFTIQTLLRIVYNFVCRLNEVQCKNFVGIGTKTNHTVGEYYADCRQICTNWIWDPKHTPKLGGYGNVVEMDESYFAGAPKYNRGRRLGTTWEPDEKWVFGLAQRKSLDCILKQVPASRTRDVLIPIINANCLDGTIFDSDGWKSYSNLAEHVALADCSHFPVNHSENYVNPETGAHTQTIEGLWSHVKDFLPSRGMKPNDLPSYLGWYMWDRYTRQRKLDPFIHFMKCAAEMRPPLYKKEYQLGPVTMIKTNPLITPGYI